MVFISMVTVREFCMRLL